jgi:glutathione synthase/RimK-type ligase-like ATP-grasp enzyme
MKSFDLAISYTWKYDREFIDLIENILQNKGLTTFVIAKFNVAEVIEKIRIKELYFKAYLDRASDEDSEFAPIATLLKKKNCYIINPQKYVVKAIDKASMQRRLERKNFRLPYTFLIPPYEINPRLNLKQNDLETIGIPFVIKPALISGGGEGVIKNAETLEQIQYEREQNPSEKYLIQEKINPRKISGRRAWFRIIWAFDRAIPTWWNDQTHIYQKVTKKEISRFNLLPLTRITSKLSRITKLDYFSTEIALTKDHQFKLIDYVNDQCDMRLKSNHVDGVPDEVVAEFIERMGRKIKAL